MASSACQCGNPLACVCFAQTPRRNDFCFDQYSTPNPQNTWQNSYVQPLPQAFMTPAPAFNRAPPFDPTPAFTQMPGFNSPPAFNTTQSIPQPLPGNILPLLHSVWLFRPISAPFVDVTNTINSAAPPASRQRKKRKAPTGSESSRSRRRVDPAPTGPAVFGVGPSTASAAASDSVSHPSLPSANLGSLVNKPATLGAAATDVWFSSVVLTLLLHQKNCPSLSHPIWRKHAQIRRCFRIWLVVFVLSKSGPRGKTSKAKPRRFGIISKRFMGEFGAK
ncbi:hypothetical protein B0H10DRAFT_1959644 [Mycena sp. CBHHK59/15]|nr:hypothetical protein B0H10DRAFT_1959644 [Mycena sp. CBHHK59/15]